MENDIENEVDTSFWLGLRFCATFLSHMISRHGFPFEINKFETVLNLQGDPESTLMIPW